MSTILNSMLSYAVLMAGISTGFCAAAKRPNVVVMLADDAGWGDFGATGNLQVRTPNIDTLAREGVSLDRFFVQPLCAPTRAEFLTGRYYTRTGVSGVSTGRERLNLDESTLAQAFKAAGYATGIFGKWHNGSQWPYHPQARGFDEFLGYTSGHWGEYFDPPLEENGRMIRGRGYIVDVCTDRALDFIARHRQSPFFCFVPFTTPHSPWAVPQEDWARFRDMPLRQTATDAAKEVPDHTRCALAMMENQDRNVGRILARLRELGLERDTIVLYFSDNGPNSWRWNGGMKGRKGQLDDGGVRSVCWLRWPGVLPAGHAVDRIAGAIDLAPTLAALTGVSHVGERPLDGRDLSPLLRAVAVADWPDRMLFSTLWGKVSVRSQTHRLDADGNLFNMVIDPGQTAPVNDAQPAVVRELTEAVDTWRREMALVESKTETGTPLDPRPFPVGYPEFPVTMLPARDGVAHGSVKRSAVAQNSSYFLNWTNVDDAMTWQVEVRTPGRYAVEIEYTCPLADVGSRIELGFLGHTLAGRVEPGWDPPLYTNQDTIPRPEIESPLKPFRTLHLGEVFFPAGSGPLTLRALEISGKTVMDVYRITLTLRQPSQPAL